MSGMILRLMQRLLVIVCSASDDLIVDYFKSINPKRIATITLGSGSLLVYTVNCSAMIVSHSHSAKALEYSGIKKNLNDNSGHVTRGSQPF